MQRVKDFATFLGRSPATASKEDVRRYQLHLSSSGARTPKINSTVSALRFFFDVMLDRADLAKQMTFVYIQPDLIECRREACAALLG